MKLNNITTLLLAPALILPAYAQSAETIKADIPFAFVAGDKTLEPGTYSIERLNSNMAAIRSEDGHGGVFVMVNAVQRGQAIESQPMLVFHRYDDAYFLSQIWTGSAGQEVHETKRERQLSAEDAPRSDIVVAVAR